MQNVLIAHRATSTTNSIKPIVSRVKWVTLPSWLSIFITQQCPIHFFELSMNFIARLVLKNVKSAPKGTSLIRLQVRGATSAITAQ